MGRKKSRNTAKTGDKKLYKSRDNIAVNESRNGSDDDDMYNEVDRFHNRREEEDMIRFEKDGDESESEDDGITTGREAVFDLGVGGSSSEEDESDESDESDDDDDDASSPEDDDASSSSDDSVEEFEDPTKTNVLDWGNKKREYYLGDTADLEIGQDEEDAEVEEEAGREIVRARLEKMDEDDFMLEDEDGDDIQKQEGKSSDKKEIETFQSSRSKESLQKLSRKEKLKLLHFSHPELLPIIEHFRDSSILKLLNETDIATDVLTNDKENAQAVGATPDGLTFLLTKSMLQTSTALNVCQYLLLKAEQVSSKSKQDSKDDEDDDIMDESYDVKNHPVINRLNQFNDLAEKLNDRVEKKIPTLDTQIQNLVKAAALMRKGQVKDVSDQEDNETASSDPAMDSSDDESAMNEADVQELMKKSKKSKQPPSSEDDNDSSSEEDEEAISRHVMNEARFSYRPNEDSERNKSSRRRRRVPVTSDLGDIEEDDEATKAAGRSLEVKLNTISQKSGSRNKKVAAAPEDQDDADDEKIRRALEMMEDEYGAGSDEESGGDDDDDDDDDIEMDDDLNDNEFYNKIKQKSQAKKEFKKKLYAVAPKYPSFEGEVEGERSIGRNIMRNRGLVAHKNKLNRNPRVKKREQYRKALIRRKGAIRDVRTDEAHKYGGEETGIKSGLSRSRKLASR